MSGQGSLFDDALPYNRTETQEQWARRMAAKYAGLGLEETKLLDRAGALGGGLTPWEIQELLELPREAIVAVRAALTMMHQAGDIERLPKRREGQHVYIATWAWRPGMGRAPSKAHQGRGSL